jgi:hypothetical protein
VGTTATTKINFAFATITLENILVSGPGHFCPLLCGSLGPAGYVCNCIGSFFAIAICAGLLIPTEVEINTAGARGWRGPALHRPAVFS